MSDWIISLSAKSHRVQNYTGSLAKPRVNAGMENESVGLRIGVDVSCGLHLITDPPLVKLPCKPVR